ncbi:hypothetical protein [Paludifilum halophilum]|uniref:Uncharacterized protein n=1 Tax=Paludifilum halophilum TaxID=1642702 RepID=A0A235B731_9BACL|nr:hypothetical protein [Paludifilum halophilum]OYD08118.1 hypothetical protein CHM34_08390 [Paludifilum halophilum]
MHVPMLNTPVLADTELEWLRKIIHRYYQECMIRWKMRIAACDFNPDQEQVLIDIFDAFIRHLYEITAQPPTSQNHFLNYLIYQSPGLNAGQKIWALSVFEEIIQSLLSEECREESQNGRSRYSQWVHCTLANLGILLSIQAPHSAGSSGWVAEKSSDYGGLHSQRYEEIIRFSDMLLTATRLEDILSYCVKDIGEMTGFKRGALIWYSPLANHLEGVYSHNIAL